MVKTVKKISEAITSSAGIFIFACAYLLLCFAGFNIFTTGTTFVNWYSQVLKIFGAFIILCSLLNKKVYRLDWKFILGILFIVVTIISCFISQEYGGLFNNLKGIIWITFEVIILFLIVRNNDDEKWINRFLLIIIILSTINVIISLIFTFVGYIYVPPLLGNNRYWCGMASGRLYGFYTDPNYGGNIAMITIFAMWYNFTNYKKKWKVFLYVILTLMQLIFIALSGSRTTIVSLLISIAVLIICLGLKYYKNQTNLAKSIKSILSAVAVCCISVFLVLGLSFTYEKAEPQILKALGGPISDPAQLFPRQFANEVSEACGIATINDEDIKYTIIDSNENKTVINTNHVGLMGRDESSDISNNRIDLWKSAIQIWKTSPIIGVGHNNILEYAKANFPDCKMVSMNQTTSHNILFDILASHGILGLIVFLALMILCLVSAIKTLIKIKNEYYIQFSLLCAILVLIFASAMFYPEILYANTIGSVVFWYILGHLRTTEQYTIGIKSVLNHGK